MERIDSCHSVWVLDTEDKRFVRLPQGSKADAAALRGKWEPYFGYEVHDDGAHVLALNEAGTRLMRFWEHTEACPHCARDKTEELRVEHIEKGGA